MATVSLEQHPIGQHCIQQLAWPGTKTCQSQERYLFFQVPSFLGHLEPFKLEFGLFHYVYIMDHSYMLITCSLKERKVDKIVCVTSENLTRPSGR